MGFYRYCGGGMHKGVTSCTVQSRSLHLGDVMSTVQIHHWKLIHIASSCMASPR